MRPQQVATIRQAQTQRSAPQLVLMNRLLQMPAIALEQAVQRELEDNPALECEDEVRCPLCNRFPCACRAAEFATECWSLADSWQHYRGRNGEPGEGDGDPIDLLAEPLTLRESLRQQLRTVVDPADYPIGDYLIENVDEDGYLRGSIEEVAAETRVAVARVEAVLRAIQSLEPPGVAARTLQECLLLQIEALRGEATVPPVTEAILRDHWALYVRRQYRRIAHRLRMAPEQVLEAVRFVRTRLTPYPGRAFRAPWSAAQERLTQPVQPDVIVERDASGALTLQLAEPAHPPLRLSQRYLRLLDELRQHPQRYSPAQRQHILDYLHRARAFLQGIEDRRDILRRVAEAIVREQRPFLETEREEDLKPMTQAHIGMLLRIDPSLISRSVAEKYLRLPSGRLVPLSFFFERAKNIKKAIESLIASEDPAQPFSDQQICDMLRAQGMVLARRTVVKYREEMKILSSRQRARRAEGGGSSPTARAAGGDGIG